MPNDERRTPKWFFSQVDSLFHFNWDLAASKENALCPLYYTKEDSALLHTWEGFVNWCNPPYSRGQLIQWVAKALCSPLATVLMLIPADCSTKAGQMALQGSNAVLMLNKRLAFDEEKSGAKFANWLCLFGGGADDREKLRKLGLGTVVRAV